MPSFVPISTADKFNTWRVRTNELIAWLNAETVNNNYAAAVPPSTSDDLDEGYQVGSIWIDTSATPNEAYRCTDNTNDAAIWLNTTLEIGDLGSIVTQDANSVNITGGNISGITDLAIEDGGTGAGTISGARTNLSVYSIAAVNALIDDLSGVSDVPGARTNLSVYSIGDVNALIDDLSGVSDVPGARTHLDVYSKAETDARASEEAVALAIALGG